MKNLKINIFFFLLIFINVATALSQTHFQPIWSSPYLPMNIYVTGADLSGGGSLGAGDEIGVFDAGNCVGFVILDSPIDPVNPVQIIASTDDPTTPELDGFIQGDSILYKYWISSSSSELENILATYTVSDGKFMSQGTAVVALVGEIPVEVEVTSERNSSFGLFQNYPNPFNPETTIEYGIPKDSDVRLIVYNLRGEEVMTLVNEKQLAGWYKVRLNANNLSSGLYLYRIIADEFIQTKKLMLTK